MKTTTTTSVAPPPPQEMVSSVAAAAVGRFRVAPGEVLQPRAMAILRRIAPYFDDTHLRSELVRWVRGEHMSKRLVDWCLTNYCKTHRPAYSTEVIDFETGRRTRQHVSLYTHYNARMRHYKRPLFDAFRRRTRLHFVADDGIAEETTVAQLNFMVWAVQYNVIGFCHAHIDAIEADMKATHKAHRKRRRECSSGSKRQELKKKPRTRIYVYPYDKLHDIPADADDETYADAAAGAPDDAAGRRVPDAGAGARVE